MMLLGDCGVFHRSGVTDWSPRLEEVVPPNGPSAVPLRVTVDPRPAMDSVVQDTVPIAGPPVLARAESPAASSAPSSVPNRRCPHCESCRVTGWGYFGRKRRYRCMACGKTFCATTKTPRAYLKHQDKWEEMFQCMVLGLSVARTANRLGIHPSTAFRWRHRIIGVLADQRSQPVLGGIVEVTEDYYPDSHKGERRLKRPSLRQGLPSWQCFGHQRAFSLVFGRDRRGQTLMGIACLGRLTVQALSQVLRPSIAPGSEVCTFRRPWYRSFCQQSGLVHHEVRAGDQLDHMCPGLRARLDPTSSVHTYNLTGVIGYQRRFRAWLNRFAGIAVKYLQEYRAWFDFLDRIRDVPLVEAARNLLAAVGDPTGYKCAEA